MCTDVAWSRQGEQIQIEGMSHSLLRPEFSSPRLEAISINWPASHRRRWQLMPTNLSHEVLFFGIEHLWKGCDWNKDSVAKKNYVIKGMFPLGFFFSTGRTSNIFLLFQHDLAIITSMTSFPTPLPFIPQIYPPPCSFSNIPNTVRLLLMSPLKTTLPWCLYAQDLFLPPSLGDCSNVSFLAIISQTIPYKRVILQSSPFPFSMTSLYFSI